MNTTALASLPDIAPGDTGLQRYRSMLLAMLSVAMMILLIVTAISHIGFHPLRLMAVTPWCWLVVAGYLAIQPLCDFLIYRRLWRISGRSLGMFFRKTAINDLVLGYAGEAHLYAWVRRHVAPDGSPFAVIRDVSIMSAMAGNAATLLLLLAALPLVGPAEAGRWTHTLGWSIAIVVLSSLVIGLARGRVLSLPRATLVRIFAIHCARIAAMTAGIALLWSLLAPDAPAMGWLALAAGRQLLTRLPFLPNKDLVFASLTTLAFGAGHAWLDAPLVAAGLIIGTQAVAAAVLATSTFVPGRARP